MLICTDSSFKPDRKETFPSSLWLKFHWLGEPPGDRPLVAAEPLYFKILEPQHPNVSPCRGISEPPEQPQFTIYAANSIHPKLTGY